MTIDAQKDVTPSPTPERTLNPWPSKEEFEEMRTDFFNKTFEISLKLIEEANKELHLFQNYSEPQLRKAAIQLTHFYFGVWMTYRRFGFKDTNYNLIWDIAGENSVIDLAAYHADKDCFVFNPELFGELAIESSDDYNYKFNRGAGGIEGEIPVNILFQIVGVEEAAHRLFFTEKKGKEIKPKSDTGSFYDYFTDELEYRALLWKKAFIDRYYPEYSESLEKTIQEARKLMDRTRVS